MESGSLKGQKRTRKEPDKRINIREIDLDDVYGPILGFEQQRKIKNGDGNIEKNKRK